MGRMVHPSFSCFFVPLNHVGVQSDHIMATLYLGQRIGPHSQREHCSVPHSPGLSSIEKKSSAASPSLEMACRLLISLLRE